MNREALTDPHYCDWNYKGWDISAECLGDGDIRWTAERGDDRIWAPTYKELLVDIEDAIGEAA